MRVAVLGGGAAGTALARATAAAHLPTVLWSRRAKDARAAARRAGATGSADLVGALSDADVVLVCVRDDALAELVARIAEVDGAKLPLRARVVFHTSGALGAAVLAPLARRGWGTGALHPLVPIPRGSTAVLQPGFFAGAGFALEARTPSVRAVGKALARELGGEAFELPPSARARRRYHLAAALVSNGALALFDVAIESLLPRAFARGPGRQALAVLLERTARNLAELGPAGALTGPVARGDVATVRLHLRSLATRRQRELYRALGRQLLDLARRSRRLDARRARELARALA